MLPAGPDLLGLLCLPCLLGLGWAALGCGLGALTCMLLRPQGVRLGRPWEMPLGALPWALTCMLLRPQGVRLGLESP